MILKICHISWVCIMWYPVTLAFTKREKIKTSGSESVEEIRIKLYNAAVGLLTWSSNRDPENL